MIYGELYMHFCVYCELRVVGWPRECIACSSPILTEKNILVSNSRREECEWQKLEQGCQQQKCSCVAVSHKSTTTHAKSETRVHKMTVIFSQTPILSITRELKEAVLLLRWLFQAHNMLSTTFDSECCLFYFLKTIVHGDSLLQSLVLEEAHKVLSQYRTIWRCYFSSFFAFHKAKLYSFVVCYIVLVL